MHRRFGCDNLAWRFGTPDGFVDLGGQQLAVPVDDDTLEHITEISGGQLFHADSLTQLSSVYATLQHQIGFQTVPGDASGAWIVLATVVLAASAAAGLLLNRPIPG